MLERKEAENNIYEISRAFAIRVVNLYKYLKEEKSEYIISKQLFQSGTSIGANVFEGKNAQSRFYQQDEYCPKRSNRISILDRYST